MSHQELFRRVRARTGMYLHGETYAEAESFVYGYDCACEGGVLAGFREWLVMRLGSGSNLAWSALVLDVAFPDTRLSRDALAAAGARGERHAIDTLFDLIDEFHEVRSKRGGLQKIFADYDRWVARRDRPAPARRRNRRARPRK